MDGLLAGLTTLKFAAHSVLRMDLIYNGTWSADCKPTTRNQRSPAANATGDSATPPRRPRVVTGRS